MQTEKAMLVNLRNRKAVIRPQLYGHFIEQTGRVVNDGLFVGKDSVIPNRDGVRLDVMEAWKDMGVPLLHWPGGITSEGYEWRKGVGERVSNINMPFNGTDDANEFGTDEFMDLCEYLGCDTYIVSGTLCTSERDLRDWMQYLTVEEPCEMTRLRSQNGHPKPWKLQYLCIGNEWWFTESAARYAEDFGRYSFVARNLMGQTGQRPKIIARGPHLYDTATTAELVSRLKPGTYDAVGFYIVASPEPNGSSSAFTKEEYFSTLRKVQETDRLISTQIGIIRGDERNRMVRLSIDEWGTWYQNEREWLWKQTVTMRDVLAVSQQLDIFNKHADEIEAACISMSVNSLCCCVMTEGSKFFRTPLYDVLKLYRPHQGAELLGSWMEEASEQVAPQAFNNSVSLLSHTASVKNGKLYLTLSNASPDETFVVNISLYGGACHSCTAQIVTGALWDKNSFDQPDYIRAREYTDCKIEEDVIRLVLSPISLVALEGLLQNVNF